MLDKDLKGTKYNPITNMTEIQFCERYNAFNGIIP